MRHSNDARKECHIPKSASKAPRVSFNTFSGELVSESTR